MKTWYEIYRDRMNASYRDYLTAKYAPFLQELYGSSALVFTEIGCGAGNMTRLLREMRDTRLSAHHLIDSCPRMLGLALENNPTVNCTFRCADVRSIVLPKSDLVHSHGLLEHFSDNDIRRIVAHGFEAAPSQLHYVPSVEYRTPSRGDERLLSPKQWRQILYGLGAVDVQQFNNGLDLIIKLERR